MVLGRVEDDQVEVFFLHRFLIERLGEVLLIRVSRYGKIPSAAGFHPQDDAEVVDVLPQGSVEVVDEGARQKALDFHGDFFAFPLCAEHGFCAQVDGNFYIFVLELVGVVGDVPASVL